MSFRGSQMGWGWIEGNWIGGGWMGGAGLDEFGWGEIVWGWVEEGLVEVNFIGKAFTRYDQLLWENYSCGIYSKQFIFITPTLQIRPI